MPLGDIDAQTRDLVAALAAFVKPIVAACLSSDNALKDLKQSCNLSSMVKSVEHNLVKSLKAYIADIISDFRSTDQPPSRATIGDNRPYTIPRKFKDTFKNQTIIRLHTAVFVMPTRLLAFDLTGSAIQLVDQREAVQILANIIFAKVDDRPDLRETIIQLLENDPTGNILQSTDRAKNPISPFLQEHTQYSILSHTLTKELSGEITFQGWATRVDNPTGYSKISNFCRVSAQNHGCYLGWDDTCCINKESSAELDEAIRSMYKWYSRSKVCVIYLAETESIETMASDTWFTRGWTLQELVAPWTVAVYSKHWSKMACNQARVANTAGISTQELNHFRLGDNAEIPISRRLQMACTRQVTREKDGAYSLMGVLDVSMSIAYGEGAQLAFLRLMQELINTSPAVIDIFNHSYSKIDDEVIPTTLDVYRKFNRSNAFDYISKSGAVRSKLANVIPIEPFILTHIGLRMHLLLFPGILRKSELHSEGDFTAKGNLFGRVWNFNLLDRSLYNESNKNTDSTVVIFGVVNFSLEDHKVIIGNPCLSIPLNCRGQKPGHIQSSHRVKLWYSPSELSPPAFKLHDFSRGLYAQNSFIEIDEGELEVQGLQHVTMYM